MKIKNSSLSPGRTINFK